MSSADAVRSLQARSDEFLNSAKDNLSRGHNNVTCFDADQAVQILLKANVLKLAGSFPRTHSLRRLLSDLGSLIKKDADVREFISKNRATITMLEDAYLRSRYAMEQYDASDAKTCLKTAKEVIKFVKTIAPV